MTHEWIDNDDGGCSLLDREGETVARVWPSAGIGWHLTVYADYRLHWREYRTEAMRLAAESVGVKDDPEGRGAFAWIALAVVCLMAGLAYLVK